MKAQLGLFEEEIIPQVRKKVIEYFLVIQPDQYFTQLVGSSKQGAGCIVNLSRESRWSVPHLSLFKMSVRSDSDEAMIHLVSEALKDVSKFRILIKGLQIFNHGPDFRSLVLGLGNPAEVNHVYQLLVEKFHLKHRSFVPHITILRSINNKDFSSLYNFMPQFDHRGSFLCDKVLILKKSTEEGSRFKVLHEVKLK